MTASTQTAPATKKPVLVRCAKCGALNRVDLARLADKPKCAKCGTPLQLDRPQTVTDADFKTIIDGSSSSVPVVVDFWADWCGPCHMMAPTLDDFARERAGDVLVLKLDTEANPKTPSQFGIRGIPTMIAFRNGKEIRRQVGVADRQKLDELMA
jgi:thioredoxin 2